jgi:hypothetical protein
MSVLNTTTHLLLELELSLRGLTRVAQDHPPPQIMAAIYAQGQRSVSILEARDPKKSEVLEALARNHVVLENATDEKKKAYFGGSPTHSKRAREEDLDCNATF